jgi:hypothetical protein
MRPILLACITASATIASAAELPPGWAAREADLVVHEQSGAKCPLELSGIKRTAIEAKGAPDLGICYYADDKDHEGLLRVRQYVRGAGETPLAIKNDRVLMEPEGNERNAVSGVRSGPGPAKNGAPTRQFVLTFKRNGLLIDCIGRQLGSDQGGFDGDFAIACKRAQGD